VQAEIGNLENKTAINQTVGRAQFSVNAQFTAVDVAHALMTHKNFILEALAKLF